MPLIRKDNADNAREANKWERPIPGLGSLDKDVSGFSDFSSLYPTIMNVAAQTIGFDLAAVEPMEQPHAFDR